MMKFEDINKKMDIYEQQKAYKEMMKKYYMATKRMLNSTDDVKLIREGFAEMLSIVEAQKKELQKLLELFEQFKLQMVTETSNMKECMKVIDDLIAMDEEYDLQNLEEEIVNKGLDDLD